MSWEFFNVEMVEEGISLVTINRPKVLNAVDFPTIKELGKIFQTCELLGLEF